MSKKAIAGGPASTCQSDDDPTQDAMKAIWGSRSPPAYLQTAIEDALKWIVRVRRDQVEGGAPREVRKDLENIKKHAYHLTLLLDWEASNKPHRIRGVIAQLLDKKGLVDGAAVLFRLTEGNISEGITWLRALAETASTASLELPKGKARRDAPRKTSRPRPVARLVQTEKNMPGHDRSKLLIAHLTMALWRLAHGKISQSGEALRAAGLLWKASGGVPIKRDVTEEAGNIGLAGWQ